MTVLMTGRRPEVGGVLVGFFLGVWCPFLFRVRNKGFIGGGAEVVDLTDIS